MATVVAAALLGGFFMVKAVIADIATKPVKPSQSPSAAAYKPSPASPTPPPPSVAPPSKEPSKPPKTPGPPECGGGFKGEKATAQQVNAALDKAAKTRFWTETPIYGVPPELIKAIAQQESGWFSNCIAADGGIGTMQLMNTTVEHMHLIFESTKQYGPYTLAGNTMLGSAYLQWLMREIGKAAFGSDFSMDPAACANRKACLLNAVISAYNFGHQAVIDEIKDGDDVNYPNVGYVDNVRELMTRY